MVEAKERTCGIRGCKCAICKLTIIDIQHDIILYLSTDVSLRFLYITVNGDPIAAEWRLSRVQHSFFQHSAIYSTVFFKM